MTTLQRRDPFHLDFPEWMNRWFDDRGIAERLMSGPAAIRVEELDDEDAHVVRAELPGIDPDEDVEVSIHDGILHISAERTERRTESEHGSYRSEFHYGRFERALPLPAGAAADDVAATYTDGVLEIRIPTRPSAREAAKVPVTRK